MLMSIGQESFDKRIEIIESLLNLDLTDSNISYVKAERAATISAKKGFEQKKAAENEAEEKEKKATEAKRKAKEAAKLAQGESARNTAEQKAKKAEIAAQEAAKKAAVARQEREEFLINQVKERILRLRGF